MKLRFAGIAILVIMAGCTKITTTRTTPPAPRGDTQTAAQTPASTPEPRQAVARQAVATPSQSEDPDRALREAIKTLNASLEDAFFDFDKYSLRADAVETLKKVAEPLRTAISRDQRLRLIVEGHCDERGSSEYNLGLGDRRAMQAKEFLSALGIPPERMRTVSFGAERPACTDKTEDCWQRNRRAHVDYERR